MNFVKKTFLKLKRPRNLILAVIGIVILGLILKSVFGNKANPNIQTRTVEYATVAQEVAATGNVKSADTVDLAFQTSGKISQINVKVGDHVSKGETLAYLDNTSEQAALTQAKAKLDQLVNGATSQDLAVSEAGVASAKTDLANAEAGLISALSDAFVKADDAVRNKADKIYYTQGSGYASFGTQYSSGGVVYNIQAPDVNTGVMLSSERQKVEGILDSWNGVSSGADETSAGAALSNLKIIQTFLNDTSSAVNILSSNNSTISDFYDSFKSDISTARTNVSTAISNLETSLQTYKAKKSALSLAESQYSLKKAPARPEDLLIDQAEVDQARANLNKTIISAPMNGVVTKVESDEGEIIAANTNQISVIADSNLEIEVYIPEADISKVKNGASASITFDAYGKDFVAQALVSSIDPAATSKDGGPTYITILQFANTDEKIKPGMTANITIKGEEKQNVLAVPQRAVASRDNAKYVRVLVGKNIVEKEVTTGLRGSDGNVEIISGLSEGEEVVTSAP